MRLVRGVELLEVLPRAAPRRQLAELLAERQALEKMIVGNDISHGLLRRRRLCSSLKVKPTRWRKGKQIDCWLRLDA